MEGFRVETEKTMNRKERGNREYFGMKGFLKVQIWALIMDLGLMKLKLEQLFLTSNEGFTPYPKWSMI